MAKNTIPAGACYLIETDVPPPDRQRYPLPQMQIGESFLLSYSPDRKMMATRVRGACSQIAKRTGFRFAVRIVPGGVRVWRMR